jgi:signal transduction histidine kinase
VGQVLEVKGMLQATLEAVPDAVILFDPQEQVISANQAARDCWISPAPCRSTGCRPNGWTCADSWTRRYGSSAHGLRRRVLAKSEGGLVPSVRACQPRLLMVLNNVLANALKYSPPRGEVVVSKMPGHGTEWSCILP